MSDHEIITDAEQQLLDACITDIQSDQKISGARRTALVALIRLRTERMDVWNSRWVGFRGIVTLGVGVHLSSEAIQVIEQYGRPGDPDAADAERVAAYRQSVDSAIERGPVFYAVRIRACDGREGWLGFEHNDVAEVILVDGFPDPVAFEDMLRAGGWVFPFDVEPPPSGRIDTFSDEELLQRLQ